MLISGGWQNSAGQYRGQYPPQSGPQPWNSPGPGQRPPGPPVPGQPGPGGGQWDQSRYPPNQQQPYVQHQQQVSIFDLINYQRNMIY